MCLSELQLQHSCLGVTPLHSNFCFTPASHKHPETGQMWLYYFKQPNIFPCVCLTEQNLEAYVLICFWYSVIFPQECKIRTPPVSIQSFWDDMAQETLAGPIFYLKALRVFFLQSEFQLMFQLEAKARGCRSLENAFEPFTVSFPLKLRSLIRGMACANA